MPLKTFLAPQEIADDLKYTEATLDENFQTLASLVAHYGGATAKAQHQFETIKLALELTESQIGKDLRDDASKAGAKVTEKAIEQEVALHPKVIERKKQLNEARAIYESHRSAYEAMKIKRDMLIQSGAARRTEMQGELRMKEGEERSARSADMVDAIKHRAAMLTGGQ